MYTSKYVLYSSPMRIILNLLCFKCIFIWKRRNIVLGIHTVLAKLFPGIVQIWEYGLRHKSTKFAHQIYLRVHISYNFKIYFRFIIRKFSLSFKRVKFMGKRLRCFEIKIVCWFITDKINALFQLMHSSRCIKHWLCE